MSAGVVIGGGLILLTGSEWIDPAISLAIVAVILWSTWGLARESLTMVLQAVPAGIDADAVERALIGLPGVARVHDLHIWPMSTTETALTAHLVAPDAESDRLLVSARELLRTRFRIAHSTIQVERTVPGVRKAVFDRFKVMAEAVEWLNAAVLARLSSVESERPLRPAPRLLRGTRRPFAAAVDQSSPPLLRSSSTTSAAAHSRASRSARSRSIFSTSSIRAWSILRAAISRSAITVGLSCSSVLSRVGSTPVASWRARLEAINTSSKRLSTTARQSSTVMRAMGSPVGSAG